MASLAFTDAFLSINAVDLSDRVKSVTLTYEAEMLDDTSMGDTTRINLAGLKNWQMQVDFKQDFAASEVDATIFPLVSGGTTFTVILRPTSASVSATNPNYTGTGIISNYSPLGNQVGELATAPVTIVPAGALSRATA